MNIVNQINHWQVAKAAVARAGYRFLLATLMACLSSAWGIGQQPAPMPPASGLTAQPPITKIEAKHLPNLLRLHQQVYSGGLPEGELAFAELQALGIKTVISVDGARPDVATAARYGLRYVHLPHGYDGISDMRGRELAKAVQELPKPIYIHCHHGKHRSPAAATVACVINGLLAPEAATAALKAAGTSENYQGLYTAAATARPLPKAEISELVVEFPEVAQLPPIAEAMVAMELHHDRLKAHAAVEWQAIAKHPDSDPAHEALLLREQFTELLRHEATHQQTAEFQDALKQSEQLALALEESLQQFARTQSSSAAAQAKTNLDRVSAACVDCHRKHRDNAH